MLQLKGKYCKDCKIFTDNIEQEALSMVYHFLDNPMFEGSKIRIMPDVHAGKDIYTTHNYIDFSMKMMRKGAVAAPEGRKLVIPFNMRDGLIIVCGKGNEDWNQSAPHGAGLLLSRSDAKELIDLDEYRESMKATNSYDSSVEIDVNEEAD